MPLVTPLTKLLGIRVLVLAVPRNQLPKVLTLRISDLLCRGACNGTYQPSVFYHAGLRRTERVGVPRLVAAVSEAGALGKN